MAASNDPGSIPSSSALPLSIIQPLDLGHLLRELKDTDDKINQDSIRTKGETAKKDIEDFKLSPRLSEIVTQSKLDIYNKKVRTQLIEYLEHIKSHAPVIHISFASEPSGKFLTKITDWLRKEIDPNVLVVVGLDPSIGAGSIVRTANHVFDLSLSTRLKKNHNILGAKLKEVTVPEAAKVEPVKVTNE